MKKGMFLVAISMVFMNCCLLSNSYSPHLYKGFESLSSFVEWADEETVGERESIHFNFREAEIFVCWFSENNRGSLVYTLLYYRLAKEWKIMNIQNFSERDKGLGHVYFNRDDRVLGYVSLDGILSHSFDIGRFMVQGNEDGRPIVEGAR